ncbi:MAG: DUF4159 domain-containing protein, partial [Rhodobacteraceae bacterium]|nr:DUF4159 domain-containing protein [Paracoccaceae bacterium]
MTMIAGIGFTAPWLLLGLLALPVLWLLLRAIPPAPKRQPFPAVTLLLGLKDDESLSDRTPWWLLLLRLLAVAAAIIGLAGPVLNPATEDTGGSGPLLIVMDASWGGAAGWKQTSTQAAVQLDEAGRAERPVAVLRLSTPEPLQFRAASDWQRQLAGLTPLPWQPGPEQVQQALEAIGAAEGGFDTVWFSDGLDYPGRDGLIEALGQRGEVEVFEQPLPVLGLMPASYTGGTIELTVQRSRGGPAQEISVVAQGKDPGGTERSLASLPLRFADGAREASAELSLPAELRARLSRFEISGVKSAGAVALTDDSLRRREVALVSSQSADEGLALLSPLHYLRQALAPSAELLEGALRDLLPANPDVIVLADVARLAPAQEEAVIDWVENGGLLLRFAGPRLAASDTARSGEDPLMPVRLRIGGRSIGGAMSWGEPKTLAPFGEGSPFYGLEVPQEVSISSQVVAQPDPELAGRVIAELADGTPLVTRKTLGQGQVVLFHVTANAEWSSLPLSGLFVSMLERLAVSSSAAQSKAKDLEGTTWTPVEVLDGFGRLEAAETLPGVAGPDLVAAPAGPELRPGVYDGGRRMLARNVLRPGDELTAARWPASVAVSGYGAPQELPLGGALITLALGLLALDVLGTLAVSGLLGRARTAALAAAVGLAALVPAQELRAQDTALPAPSQAQTQEDLRAAAIASELVLAHVLTGDAQVDRVAAAGLRGLTDTLFFRTSVEPAAPAAVDLERDELAFYPLLYWPITRSQPLPSSEAYAKLNTYLRSGGMILFDTRDADLAASGATSPAARRL